MRKVRARWKVYWNRRGRNAYLYGSEIFFHAKEHVEFRNALIAPGTCLMRWTSRTNFQRDHAEPELPIIDGESSYHISVDMETDKEDGCLVRLAFEDRYGNGAGSLLVQGREMDFRCPLKTYAYEIQLIGAGASVLHFHSITIMEYEPEKVSLEKAESGKAESEKSDSKKPNPEKPILKSQIRKGRTRKN